jgi:hypothetical protein
VSESAALRDEVAKATRSLFSIAILRWLFGLIFLFVAFSEFPDHKWSIGLGLIVFNLGIAGVCQIVQGLHVDAYRMDDLAERKTRHTVLLAAERLPSPDHETGEFWAEVDRRVRAEVGEPTKVGFWKSVGLVGGRVLWGLFADLFGIGIVASLTGGG